MSKTTFEAELSRKGRFTYTNTGVSMRPLLKQGRDLFTIEKKTGRCSKYDVVLYKRPPSRYILHRVIKVNENGYDILGDNCVNVEYDIKEEDVIGVMTSFVRKGKECSVNSTVYRLYSRIWYYLYPARKAIMKLRIRLRESKRNDG